ncbi:methyltransferase domain-containing protein [Immundisolibacter sp.]|uniref:class I SAM-dependent methyltransferase n=1 Tax=Immundisolibacter sp. TaxID=1934948 RepID=UPI002632C4B0|nr:methyltransferase domain-containing protein [Immundisolibacter sp.]MDD3651404.1 methyltransferase domain-containing protein [Immundisolibacter sp.]
MQPPDPVAAPSAPGKHSSFDFVAHAPVLDALAGAGCVLGLGCGRGDWSLALARRGTPVLAVDRWVEGLAWLRAQAHGLPLLAVRADLTAPLPLADGSIDGVLLALVLHHLAGAGRAASVLAQIARALRPGGVLAIVEFLPVPPPPGPPLAVRLSPADVLALAAGAGLAGGPPVPVADHVGLYVQRKSA